MFGISRKLFNFVTGLAVSCFIGYCIYFDYQRCHAPDYKKKVRERRQRRRSFTLHFDPNSLNEPEQLQRYFVVQLQIGNSLIARGEVEKGVDHLVNATIVSGRANRMMQLYETTLPPPIFGLLYQRLKEMNDRFAAQGITPMPAEIYTGQPYYYVERQE